MRRNVRRVMKSRGNLLARQTILGGKLIRRRSRRKPGKDSCDIDTSSRNTGLAEADFRVHRNARKDLHVRTSFGPPYHSCRFVSFGSLSRSTGPKNEARREALASRRAISHISVCDEASLPIFLVELFDLVHSRLQVRVLNRAVEIDRIAICLLELVQMQRAIVNCFHHATAA